MGVDGLWKLIGPTGHKIKIESLSGEMLAIDASLWLTQFIKAMRNENGDIIENAHLLGMFRRICKLIYFNIKPVFVFDGPAPSLKRQTLQQRRQKRIKANDDIKRNAQKLLLNQLKMRGIKTTLQNIQNNNINNSNNNNNNNNNSDNDADKILGRLNSDGFLFMDDEDNDINNNDNNNDNESINDSENDDDMLRPLKRGKQEMSDNDSDMNMNSNDNNNDNNDDFYAFPNDCSKLTPKEIAQMPASMQYDIMQKRRELQRESIRKEFFVHAGNPNEYAQFQLKNFLKTSSLNMKIENLRKKMVKEYNETLLKDNNININGIFARRIASEKNLHYYYNKGNDNDNTNEASMFVYNWMDKKEKKRRREYIAKEYGKKRKLNNGETLYTDYKPQILQTSTQNGEDYKQILNEIKQHSWNCKKCGHLNYKQRKYCGVCLKTRDERKYWDCNVCGNKVDIKRNTCNLCDSSKDKKCKLEDIKVNLDDNDEEGNNDDIRRLSDIESNSNGWICQACGCENGIDRNKCDECQLDRSCNGNGNGQDIPDLVISDIGSDIDMNEDTKNRKDNNDVGNIGGPSPNKSSC